MKREIINILKSKITITEDEILASNTVILYSDTLKESIHFLIKEIKNKKVNSMVYTGTSSYDENKTADFIYEMFPICLSNIEPSDFKGESPLTIKKILEEMADYIIAESLQNIIPNINIII